MKAFKVNFSDTAKEITIKGTSFTFPFLVVEFEYGRRLAGKMFDMVAHLFESVEQLEANNEITVTNVIALNIVIMPKGKGTIIQCQDFKASIILKDVPFEITEDFARQMLMLAYNEIGFNTVDL